MGLTKLRATLVCSLCAGVGIVIGGTWRDEGVQAQARVSRLRTERQGELLLIRYLNSVNGVECFLGMDNTGIVSVPCDARDRDLYRP
jgi:hypothetical protein